MSKQISISKQPSESLILLELTKDSELLKKAETLIDFRGYNIEEISQTPTTIDIQVSHPDSEDAIMMQIVTQTDYKNNGVGVHTVEDTEDLLAKPDVDKVIIFGNRFTESAKNELRGEGIEFFSPTQNILSRMSQQELYTSILTHVDALCVNTCGSTPQSSTDCMGYSKQITLCPTAMDGENSLIPSPSMHRTVRRAGAVEKRSGTIAVPFD